MFGVKTSGECCRSGLLHPSLRFVGGSKNGLNPRSDNHHEPSSRKSRRRKAPSRLSWTHYIAASPPRAIVGRVDENTVIPDLVSDWSESGMTEEGAAWPPKRGQIYARQPLEAADLRHSAFFFSPFIHALLFLIHNPCQFLPSGTPIMTVVAWGGAGASA